MKLEGIGNDDVRSKRAQSEGLLKENGYCFIGSLPCEQREGVKGSNVMSLAS